MRYIRVPYFLAGVSIDLSHRHLLEYIKNSDNKSAYIQEEWLVLTLMADAVCGRGNLTTMLFRVRTVYTLSAREVLCMVAIRGTIPMELVCQYVSVGMMVMLVGMGVIQSTVSMSPSEEVHRK